MSIAVRVTSVAHFDIAWYMYLMTTLIAVIEDLAFIHHASFCGAHWFKYESNVAAVNTIASAENWRPKDVHWCDVLLKVTPCRSWSLPWVGRYPHFGFVFFYMFQTYIIYQSLKLPAILKYRFCDPMVPYSRTRRKSVPFCRARQ